MPSEYIQLYPNIGHQKLNDDFMFKDDFYILITKNQKTGIRKKQRIDGNIIFKIDEINLDFLKSDLVRFCLAIYKNNRNIHYGEMSLIPKQTIPIPEALQEYIESFLPDYYDIRTNRTKI